MRTQIWRIERKLPGQIAIVPRPRGGDWLEDEARAWAQNGLDTIVSLLTDEEMFDLDIVQESAACLAAGLEFINFPIVDRSVPGARDDVFKLIERLAKMLAAGKNIGIHCRQGIGRSALIAAALFISLGVDEQTALREINLARGCQIPETVEQQKWIDTFAVQEKSFIGV